MLGPPSCPDPTTMDGNKQGGELLNSITENMTPNYLKLLRVRKGISASGRGSYGSNALGVALEWCSCHWGCMLNPQQNPWGFPGPLSPWDAPASGDSNWAELFCETSKSKQPNPRQSIWRYEANSVGTKRATAGQLQDSQ